jgi:hypothetical protein
MILTFNFAVSVLLNATFVLNRFCKHLTIATVPQVQYYWLTSESPDTRMYLSDFLLGLRISETLWFEAVLQYLLFKTLREFCMGVGIEGEGKIAENNNRGENIMLSSSCIFICLLLNNRYSCLALYLPTTWRMLYPITAECTSVLLDKCCQLSFNCITSHNSTPSQLSGCISELHLLCLFIALGVRLCFVAVCFHFSKSGQFFLKGFYF